MVESPGELQDPCGDLKVTHLDSSSGVGLMAFPVWLSTPTV